MAVLPAAGVPLTTSGYTLLITDDPTVVAAAQRLRHEVFATELGATLHPAVAGLDTDGFDAYCDHLVVLGRAPRRWSAPTDCSRRGAPIAATPTWSSTSPAAFLGEETLWTSVRRVLAVRDLSVAVVVAAALHPDRDADRRVLARVAESAIHPVRSVPPARLHGGLRPVATREVGVSRAA